MRFRGVLLLAAVASIGRCMRVDDASLPKADGFEEAEGFTDNMFDPASEPAMPPRMRRPLRSKAYMQKAPQRKKHVLRPTNKHALSRRAYARASQIATKRRKKAAGRPTTPCTSTTAKPSGTILPQAGVPLDRPVAAAGGTPPPLAAGVPLNSPVAAAGVTLPHSAAGVPLNSPLAAAGGTLPPLAAGAPLNSPVAAAGGALPPLAAGVPLNSTMAAAGGTLPPLAAGVPLNSPVAAAGGTLPPGIPGSPAGNPTAVTGSLPPGIPGLPVGSTTLAPVAATTVPAGPLSDLYKLTAEGEQVVNEVDNSVKNTILDLRWIKAAVARLKAQGAASSAEEYLKKVVGSDTEDFKTKVEENLKLVEELVGKGEKTLGMAQADMKESKDGIQKAEEVMAAQKALKTATASLSSVPKEEDFENSDPKA